MAYCIYVYIYVQLETLSLELILCTFIPQHPAVHNITTHIQFKPLATPAVLPHQQGYKVT